MNLRLKMLLLSKPPTACKSFLRCEQLLRVVKVVYSSHELPKPRYVPNHRYRMFLKLLKNIATAFFFNIFLLQIIAYRYHRQGSLFFVKSVYLYF